MSENNHNKLVRDNIPSIIEKSGRKVDFRQSKNREELLSLLGLKLIEESKEYVQNQNIEELADIMEILCSILDLTNTSFDTLQEIRRKKKQTKGGFEKGYILFSIQD
ncbi:MAG: phosphoribosyl-ATP pyrophosphohydrolase [Asgard group archaeon]|nr:phosphoribosyl-ATP pyrophosphohydrolase [Asgard group archaeon]